MSAQTPRTEPEELGSGLIRPELAGYALPIEKLRTRARNPRRGDVTAIAASLRRHGQYRPIVARADGEVLAGNHTLLAARELGWPLVAAVLVDVDDETAARIVLADNRTADLGGYDSELLAELLSELPELEGTGYSDRDLADLLESLEPVSDSAELLADTPDAAVGEQYGVIVICTSEEQQASVYERLQAEGFELRVVTV